MFFYAIILKITIRYRTLSLPPILNSVPIFENDCLKSKDTLNIVNLFEATDTEVFYVRSAAQLVEISSELLAELCLDLLIAFQILYWALVDKTCPVISQHQHHNHLFFLTYLRSNDLFIRFKKLSHYYFWLGRTFFLSRQAQVLLFIVPK